MQILHLSVYLHYYPIYIIIHIFLPNLIVQQWQFNNEQSDVCVRIPQNTQFIGTLPLVSSTIYKYNNSNKSTHSASALRIQNKTNSTVECVTCHMWQKWTKWSARNNDIKMIIIRKVETIKILIIIIIIIKSSKTTKMQVQLKIMMATRSMKCQINL